MITQQRLRELFFYDGEDLINLARRGRRGHIGAVAGNYDKDGYIIIQIGGIKYRRARLIWLYVTGQWPEYEVDHKNGIPDDDSWDNLRDATRSDNVANSTRPIGSSGLRGVNRDPKNPTLWRARVAYGNSRQWLGPFDTAKEAHEAYLAAAEDKQGEFALHNRPQPFERRI